MQIHDHEKRALQVLNRLNPHNCHRLIGHGFGPQEATEIAYLIADEKTEYNKEPIESFDQLSELGINPEEIDMLYHWSLGVVAEQHQAMLRKLEMRYEAKTANRTRYLPEAVLQYRRYNRKKKLPDGNVITEETEGWRFDMMLRSAGLLNLMIETIHGDQAQPVAMQLVNMLPHDHDPKTGKQTTRPPIPPEEWIKANNHGIAVSGERLGFNMESFGWKILKTAFPNSVWLSAYGHSLNSPVLPEGYWPKTPITFRKLVDTQDEELGTDGSGLWNVDHPIFQSFIAKHGCCAWQIRAIHPHHGVFAKGAVRPVNLGADGPAFVLDWNQIKGVKKKDALRKRDLGEEFEQQGMYIGCMQVWNNPRAKLKSCFEMLENIKVNNQTVSIVKELIDEAIEKLRIRGTDRIIGKICDDDERIAQTVQLVNMLAQRGANINTTQIPMVRKAVKAKLERILWHMAQGAGITYQQRLCILDNTIAPGTVAVAGIKPGTVITTFRFPMVLAQGLKTLTVVTPSPHMLCNGQAVPGIIFMNPADLTTGMQGDDDGDIVGISDDPRMVKLFEHVIDTNIYHIEPAGKKIWYDVESPEGLDYLRWDQRGPVGLATNYRSRLLAVGDIAGANAMSLVIQECVDAAKRKPEWSDFRAAANLENWIRDENGEYHFNIRFKPEELEEGDLPLNMMQEWVHERLMERGCAKVIYTESGPATVPDNACAWRWPGKRIDMDEWVPTTQRTKWRGGNLVHICHNYAFERFIPVLEEFRLNEPLINMSMLLPVMLAQRGIPTQIMYDGHWIPYKNDLRKRAGLVKFGDKMQAIYDSEKQMDHEDQLRAIDSAIAELNHTIETANLTIDEIATIWVMETSRIDEKTGLPLPAGINNAFRVLSTPNNEVMLALGIVKSASCKWMYQTINTKTGEKKRLEHAVEHSMRQTNPQKHLAEAIFKDTQHARDCSDEDGKAIALWECPVCKQAVTDALVHKIRANHQSKESRWLANITSTMNRS